MSIGGSLCFQLSRIVKQRQGDWKKPTAGPAADTVGADEAVSGNGVVNPAAFSSADYSEWRDAELHQQFNQHFDKDAVNGRVVLDFGCGYGGLSFLAADLGAQRVVGADLLESDIEKARHRATLRDSHALAPEFVLFSSADRIDLPDDTFDVILCFDVLEHIMDYEAIIPEWRRVLKADGKVLIWWQPYYHPYGHHLHNYVAFPWAHVFFSNKAMAEACTKIYYAPEYKPRFWDLDADGNKRMNRVFDPDNLGGVNGLTMGRFENLCRRNGMKITRREIHPFTGPAVVRAVSGALCRVPVLREFFSAFVIYEVTNGEGGHPDL